MAVTVEGVDTEDSVVESSLLTKRRVFYSSAECAANVVATEGIIVESVERF